LTLYSKDRVRVLNANEAGAFEFTALPHGTYELQAESPGFRSQTMEDIEIADTRRSAITIVLSAGEGSGCTVRELKPGETPHPENTVSYERRNGSTEVIGVVHGYEDGRPLTLLPSAKVELLPLSKPGGSQVVTSNAKGEFRISDLGPGKYELHASRDGYWNLEVYRNLTPIRFWITRESLTRMSLDLILRGKEPPC
jgi:hypothetical protein